jgi:hypothetical protein
VKIVFVLQIITQAVQRLRAVGLPLGSATGVVNVCLQTRATAVFEQLFRMQVAKHADVTQPISCAHGAPKCRFKITHSRKTSS